MTARDFIRLIGPEDLDKELVFITFVNGEEMDMAVDGVDEASDENFIGINLKEI